MTRNEFRAGDEWAYRRTATLGAPAQRVQVLLLPKGRGGRCKVRHLDGELEGLEEFVANAHLRSRWRDWKKTELDEARELKLIDGLGADLPEATTEAAELVFAATGEDLFLEGHRGYTRHLAPDALERVGTRCGLQDQAWQRPPAFVDQRGRLTTSNNRLVDLAIAFASAEPESVHLHLDNTEAEYLQGGFGSDWEHTYLLRLKPAIALARQWAGGAAEHKHLRDELSRMKLLVYEAIRALRAAGDERSANRIERKLD